MRAIALPLLLILSAGCGTTYRKARPDLPANEREAAELNALHDDFERALEERRFEEAEAMLAELEEGMENASQALVLHRSYPVLSAQVVRGQKRLKTARRTANVERIVEDTQALVTELRELRAGYEQSGGTEDELDRIDELMETLEDQLEDNQSFAKDPRYRDVGADAETALQEARRRRHIYAWQRKVNERLNDILDDAPELAADPTDLVAAAQAADQRAEALEECARVGEELAHADGASVDVSVATSLSIAPLDDVRASCAAEAETARAESAAFRWRHGVQITYDEITSALQAIEASKKKRESLAAHEAAVAAMAACPEKVDSGVPGYDDATRFSGHLGTKNAESLGQACLKVVGNLEARLPLLRWQSELELEGERYVEATERFDSAKNEEDPSERLEPLTTALQAFESCQARAGALALGDEEQWAGADLKKSNRRAAAKLEKRCRLIQAKVKKALEQARSEASAE